jgi:hypothetical protein
MELFQFRSVVWLVLQTSGIFCEFRTMKQEQEPTADLYPYTVIASPALNSLVKWTISIDANNACLHDIADCMPILYTNDDLEQLHLLGRDIAALHKGTRDPLSDPRNCSIVSVYQAPRLHRSHYPRRSRLPGTPQTNSRGFRYTKKSFRSFR